MARHGRRKSNPALQVALPFVPPKIDPLADVKSGESLPIHSPPQERILHHSSPEVIQVAAAEPLHPRLTANALLSLLASVDALYENLDTRDLRTAAVDPDSGPGGPSADSRSGSPTGHSPVPRLAPRDNRPKHSPITDKPLTTRPTPEQETT
jgi:hypothetical protein